MLNRLFEAFRRLLVLIVWLPTVVVLGIVLFDEDASITSDLAIMIVGACIFGSLVAHFVINWIFQFNEQAPSNIEETKGEHDDQPLTSDGYMAKNAAWHLIFGGGWVIGIIWLGHSRNGYSTPPWGTWSSVDSFINYHAVMWPYFGISFGGYILFMYLVRRNYEKYLKRLGY